MKELKELEIKANEALINRAIFEVLFELLSRKIHGEQSKKS